MRKNDHNDIRINTHSVSLKMYIAIFSAVMFVFSIFTVVYTILNSTENIHLYVKIGTMIVFIMIVSLITLFLFEYFRKLFFMKPIKLIQNVTKQVASGDFSIHIDPQRNDGLIDEFEVIYQDLNAMITELASVEILRQDFVSNVSHELKTPLAIIQNYVVFLQDQSISQDERLLYTNKIVDVTNRLSLLVSTILQLNQFENQKPNFKPSAFNLSEQISRCALKYEAIWTDKNIDMNIELDQDISILADEKILDVVWDNLISNALKFTGENGSITVQSCVYQDELKVKIKDNGIGISKNGQKHIFDKFYQDDISHATKGNGLGLALVKKILTIMNCRITVKSEPEKGAEFTVIFDKSMIIKDESQ